MFMSRSTFYVFLLSAHASIMFQMYDSNIRGPPEEGQVGRVAAQPTCAGRGRTWPKFKELPPSYKLSSTLCSCLGCKVCGYHVEGQVGRVEQPTCIGMGPHMGLGIQSYIPAHGSRTSCSYICTV